MTRKPPKAWQLGDRLFFWKSAPHLCLCGLGEIVRVFDRDSAGDAFFDVRYLTSELPNPVHLERLRDDPLLSDASFLKPGAAGTVFAITDTQRERLATIALAENGTVSAADASVLRRFAGYEGPASTNGAMKALLIREPFVDWILDGTKTWEVRGSNTKVRGTIALAKSGTGTIVGTCELVDALGPLSLDELRAGARKLNTPRRDIDELPYSSTYAWVVRNARRLANPVPYRHPPGAVIWVNLAAGVAAEIAEQ